MYCNGEDKNGNRIYIAAWTQVEPITVEAKSSCLKYCSKYARCLMAIAFSLC